MEHILKIGLGKNFFSLTELADLKKNDVIVTTKQLGTPADLYWNNQKVAEGEIVVLDVPDKLKLFGLRVSSFKSETAGLEIPCVKEKLLEIVELEIILDRKKVTDREISQIGETSFINLGKLVDSDLELYLSDMPVARGRVCCVNENFGMEITEVYPENPAVIKEYSYKSTGNIVKGERLERKYKLYNFQIPDKFSWKQLNNIVKIHERFIDNMLHNIGKKGVKASVKAYDQLTWEEYFDYMKERKVDVVSFLPGRSGKREHNFLDLEANELKFSPEDKKGFELFLANVSRMNLMFRVFLVREKGTLFTNEQFEISLKKAWEYIAHVEPGVLENNAAFDEYSKLLPPSDMICIFQVRFDDNGTKEDITIVYPYISIEEMIPKLGTSLF